MLSSDNVLPRFDSSGKTIPKNIAKCWRSKEHIDKTIEKSLILERGIDTKKTQKKQEKEIAEDIKLTQRSSGRGVVPITEKTVKKLSNNILLLIKTILRNFEQNNDKGVKKIPRKFVRKHGSDIKLTQQDNCLQGIEDAHEYGHSPMLSRQLIGVKLASIGTMSVLFVETRMVSIGNLP